MNGVHGKGGRVMSGKADKKDVFYDVISCPIVEYLAKKYRIPRAVDQVLTIDVWRK